MFKLIEQYGPLVGRIFLAGVFFVGGFHKITGFEGTAQYMAGKGLPMVPFLLVLSTIIELGGAALLALGWHARWAALVIFLFVIPVTLVFHPFWTDANQLWFFWKNVAIMGGMLYIMAYGPGPFSMDQRRR